MVRYRKLDLEELNELEPKFVNFLAANGVEAQEWTALKDKGTKRVDELIGLFSDMVFDKIMTDTQYLDFEEEDKRYYFRCLETRLELIVLEGLKQDESSIYSLEKEYSKERNLEIFDMLETGCVISDGSKFKSAALAIANSQD